MTRGAQPKKRVPTRTKDRTSDKRARTKDSVTARTSGKRAPTDLVAAQRARLRLGEHAGLATVEEAAKFLAEVAIALRYDASDKLPLASMYRAVCRAPEPERAMQHRAAVITNALIADGRAVEVTVIADRVCIADAALVPALIALRRRGKDVALTDTAQRVLGYLAHAERPTAGEVRAFLGVPPKTWPNAADDALAELQHAMVIDRGATSVPETGVPYLGKEGIPYRLIDPALVKAAARLTVAAAAEQLVRAYLRGARYAPSRKLASLFKACVTTAELGTAIAALVAAGELAEVVVAGKSVVVAV